MKRLYGQFVKPGDLVFNVGANTGTRTAIFVELGARVIAVEPQAQLFSTLSKRFMGDPVTPVEAAVGATQGEVELHLCPDNHLATCAPGWAKALEDRWPMEKWYDKISVPQITLDWMIEQFGRPDFIKIDVEGYEDQALLGLTQKVPALSFEFTVPYLDPALKSLELVEKLGLIWFNWIEQEIMQFKSTNWISAHMIAGILNYLPVSTFYGDVFAIQEVKMEKEEKKSKRPELPKISIRDGMIVAAPDLGIWCIDGEERRAVPDVVTQIKMGIGMHHVVMLHPEQLEEIPEGKPMPKIPLRRIGSSRDMH